MGTQLNSQKTFLFQTIQIQFSVSTISMSKTVKFQIIQFSISTQFKCKYGLFVKNISYFKLFSLLKQLVGFYGISIFVDYLTPNPFLCK